MSQAAEGGPVHADCGGREAARRTRVLPYRWPDPGRSRNAGCRGFLAPDTWKAVQNVEGIRQLTQCHHSCLSAS